MNKILLKLDSLPIVPILQAGAVLVFIVGLSNLGSIWYQAFDGAFEPTKRSIFDAAWLSTKLVGHILFEPLVILALAEIIKGQAQETNLHD